MWKGFGFLFVGLGTIGIYIPGIPTTSFMVLAAVCFAKSDPKMFLWLLNNPLFGHYIRNFIEGKGIPYEYEKHKIKWEDHQWRSYTPDFVINSNGIIVETKGRFTPADRRKHLKIKEQ